MKYIIVLGDGMSDYPIEKIDNKTPLAYANTPTMDELAKVSEIGLVHTIPEGMSPGSDTANLSVIGYDPKVYYTGRSPLEALSIGVDMNSTDIAFRCNIVTLSEDESDYFSKKIIKNPISNILNCSFANTACGWFAGITIESPTHNSFFSSSIVI